MRSLRFHRHRIFSSYKKWMFSQIFKEVFSVYENIKNWQNVTKRCRTFAGIRANIHEEPRTGRPYVISNILHNKTEKVIQANRHLKKHLATSTMRMKWKSKLKCCFNRMRLISISVGYNSLHPDLTGAKIMKTTMLKNKAYSSK